MYVIQTNFTNVPQVPKDTCQEETSDTDSGLNGNENAGSDPACDKTESDTLSEGSSVVKTNLSPGKVVRRKKISSKNQTTAQNRASFPQARPLSAEAKSTPHQLIAFDDGMDSSVDRIEGNPANSADSRTIVHLPLLQMKWIITLVPVPI